MRSLKLFLSLAVLTGSLFLTGCGSDDTTPTPPSTPRPTAPTAPVTFQPADAHGVLYAIKTRTGNSTSYLGTALAHFPTTLGNYAMFQDAGEVVLNNTQLTRDVNQAYFFTVDSTLEGGLSFANGVNWSVSGKNTVPAFGAVVTEFPSFPSQASWPSQIVRANGLTLNFGAISGADSIQVTVTDSLGVTANLYLPGTATQAVFASADLAGLTAAKAWLRVSPYRVLPLTLPTTEVFYRVNVSASKKEVSVL